MPNIQPQIITFPQISDPRGNLSIIEEESHIPFKIKRVYWIYDVPGGEKRGGHAFRETQEVIVALSGSFDVLLNDGEHSYRYPLNRSNYGVLVPKMIWRSLENFSTNSLALIIASTDYSKEEYIYDFEAYKLLQTQ